MLVVLLVTQSICYNIGLSWVVVDPYVVILNEL
jgi:hypothetical protein